MKKCTFVYEYRMLIIKRNPIEPIFCTFFDDRGIIWYVFIIGINVINALFLKVLIIVVFQKVFADFNCRIFFIRIFYF